jgi:hypothetical protein
MFVWSGLACKLNCLIWIGLQTNPTFLDYHSVNLNNIVNIMANTGKSVIICIIIFKICYQIQFRFTWQSDFLLIKIMWRWRSVQKCGMMIKTCRFLFSNLQRQSVYLQFCQLDHEMSMEIQSRKCLRKSNFIRLFGIWKTLNIEYSPDGKKKNWLRRKKHGWVGKIVFVIWNNGMH